MMQDEAIRAKPVNKTETYLQENLFFIGRENELEQLFSMAENPRRSGALCIQGQGGIGKTTLLREFAARARRKKTSYTVRIYDFDDIRFQAPSNIRFLLARDLGSERFADYINDLEDFERARQQGESPQRLEKRRERVHRSWHHAFANYIEKTRLIIAFDTTEKLPDLAIEQLIEELWGQQFPETLFLISGRNADKICQKLHHYVPESLPVQLLNLEGFDDCEGDAYLSHREADIFRELSREQHEKVLYLGMHKPILIDLAVEWYGRNEHLEWLDNIPLSVLKAHIKQEKKSTETPENLYQWRNAFEERLVLMIGEAEEYFQRLILLLAHVSPLNAHDIESLLELSEGEADHVFRATREYVFVKNLPHEHIQLHDEMRRMINLYLWPQRDQNKRIRRAYSKRAIYVLEEKEQALLAEHNAAPKDNFVAEYTRVLRLRSLREQHLAHTLFAEPEEGLRYFSEQFDHCFGFSEYDPIGYLNNLFQLLETEAYLQDVSDDKQYDYYKRKIKYQLSYGHTQAASKTADALRQLKVSPKNKVDILILLGNLELKSGYLGKGVHEFEAAVEHAQHLKDPLLEFRTRKSLGWALRVMGDHEAADRQYQHALHLTTRKIQPDQIGGREMGELLNSMAYVRALMRDRDSALNLCRHARDLWRESGYHLGLGIVESTLGRIYIEFDEYDQSIFHFQQSLDYLGQQSEWLSKVYLGLTHAWILKKDTMAAVASLHDAEDHLMPNDEPEFYHLQANLWFEEEDPKDALVAYQQCLEISRQSLNQYYEIRALVGMGKIASYCHGHPEECEGIEGIETHQSLTEKKRHFLQQARNQEFADSLSIALLNRYLGDLALFENNWDRGLALYKKALPIIAQKGRHYPVNLRSQLERIRRLVLKPLYDADQANEAAIYHLAEELLAFWQAQDLDLKHPDAFFEFEKWSGGRPWEWDNVNTHSPYSMPLRGRQAL